MKRALALSLFLHAAVLVCVWFLWPSKAASLSRVHLQALSLPGLDSNFSVPPEEKPALPGMSSEAAPPPQEAAPGGSEDLVVDALTPGPAWERPSLLDYPTPAYPRNARRLGWEGIVELDVSVDSLGHLGGASVVKSSGHPLLDEAALEALREAKFRPGARDGVPEATHLTVLVRFRRE